MLKHPPRRPASTAESTPQSLVMESTMAGKTAKKFTKLANKAAAKPGAAKASKPRKTPTKSKSPPIEGAGKRSRERATGKPASRLIDQRIRDLGGWRGETLARMRALILEADPEMTEEWKW